ncbi:hypothetical protein IFM89_032886 [Coptis chinensis]|uniref:Myb/SANT-like domain-containing protein n=1 Tax=Coptis chinensis TaxID=261450 RepID=A0A835MGB8_9MAGN|nr:hypothetical protein IFM89_032886 [Coptis chinensis]
MERFISTKTSPNCLHLSFSQIGRVGVQGLGSSRFPHVEFGQVAKLLTLCCPSVSSDDNRWYPVSKSLFVDLKREECGGGCESGSVKCVSGVEVKWWWRRSIWRWCEVRRSGEECTVMWCEVWSGLLLLPLLVAATTTAGGVGGGGGGGVGGGGCFRLGGYSSLRGSLELVVAASCGWWHRYRGSLVELVYVEVCGMRFKSALRELMEEWGLTKGVECSWIGIAIMARRAANSSKGKGVVSEGEVTKSPVPRKSDNGWKPETLKEVVEAVNQRLNMSIGNDNVRSRLKTMKKDYLAAKAAVEASGFGFSYNLQTKCIDDDHAHPTARPLRKKMFPHFEEACIVFGSDVATGEGGNAGHDDEEVVILDEEVTDEGPENTEEESSQPPSPHLNANDGDSSPGESFVVGDSTQAGSRRITTPSLVKRKRSRLGLEAMPPPPDFKELTDAVHQLTNAFTPVDPSTLLIAALEELPNMEPDLILRALDLLVENEPLLKFFLGIRNPQLKYSWLIRKLEQSGKFVELGSILELGRPPKLDKAAILSDAVRMVTKLLGESEKLKESNESLQEKIKELKGMNTIYSSTTRYIVSKVKDGELASLLGDD